MSGKWNLRITDRRGRAKVLALESFPAVLGRDESLPLALDDPQVSRRHCQLDPNDDRSIRVTDLNSTNGIFLNGKKVTKGVIADGDRLKLGDTIVEFNRPAEVTINEDTGARALSILKSFSAAQKHAPQPKADGKAAILSRIGSPESPKIDVNLLNLRFQLLADITHLLAATPARDEVFKIILEGICKVYPIDRCVILLRRESTGTLDPVFSKNREGAGGGLVVSRTICSHVYSSNEAIVTEDAVADPRFSSGDSIIEHHIGSVVAAPISARGSILGVLYCSTQERATHFTESDLSFFALAGNLIALTILLDAGATAS